MRFTRCISTIDSHTGGMPTRMVVAGVPYVPGSTMAAKRQYVIDELYDVVNALIDEPRGHGAMRGAILTPPCTDGADIGVVFIGGGCMPSCGHSTIGVVTTILETGMIRAVEPVTDVAIDTPAGLVLTKATVEAGRVKAVSMINVPAFLYEDGIVIDAPGIGRVAAAIAFGGNFYAIVRAADVSMEVRPDRASTFIELAQRIKQEINTKIRVVHPEKPFIDHVSHVQFWGPPMHPEATMKNIVISPPGLVDRSPCGTGTCARMASLYGRGELSIGDEFVHESVIGTVFRGRLLRETAVGSYKAVVPEVSGSAHITGIHQFMVDPDDALAYGFTLG